MRRSEIFDNFIKIAEEKGLISDKNYQSDIKKTIKRLEESRSHETRTGKEIEELYNVKPDLPKNMEYEFNIIEDAHPDSVIIGPSYDKLNALVENENERQNITLNILNKIPTGQSFNHKYAKNLALNLFRLNNIKNKEISKLADTCLNQMTKKANPLIIPALVAASLGALYVQQHMDNVNEGFETNYKNLVDAVNNLITSNSNYGVGYSFKPAFIKEMQNFKAMLDDLYSTYTKNIDIINTLEKPKTAQDLLQIAQQSSTTTVADAYKELRAKIANLAPYIDKVLKDFASQDYKERQISEKGLLTSLIDRTQVLHGR